jgi:MtN3 and saliva related transmembrane protein
MLVYNSRIMSVLSILATVSGIIASFAIIPQVYKIFKRKSAKDISPWTYAYLALSGFIWVAYGFEINSFPLIITNLIGSITLLIVVFGWFCYGRDNPAINP